VSDARGDFYLSDSLVEPSGVRLEGFRTERLVVDGERAVFGGRLPHGAVRAEAVDANGERIVCAVDGGAWVTFMADTLTATLSPAVAFRDADGVLVVPALPAEWPRDAVTDTKVQCPACCAVTWDEVLPLDGSGGTGARGSEKPRLLRVLVCRTCGHKERMGLSFRFQQPSGEQAPEARARLANARRRRDDRYRQLLSAVTFPIFAADGWMARVTGFTSSDDDVTGVVVAHGAGNVTGEPLLEIRSDCDDAGFGDSVLAVTREALACSLHDDQPHPCDISDAARTLATKANERLRRRAAFRSAPYVHQIQVDNVAVPFICLQHEEHWAASTYKDGWRICMSARGVDINAVRLFEVPHPIESLLVSSDGSAPGAV
jgi:hypothetical protein